MNKAAHSKLAAHVDQLLGLFLGTREHYELLRPIMRRHKLIVELSKNGGRAGFERMRHILYWSFIQELMKLITDKSSRRIPSIDNILQAIENPAMKGVLQKQYVHNHMSGWPDEKSIAEKNFTQLYARSKRSMKGLLKSKTVRSYRNIRDRLLAHYELVYFEADESYKLTDISVHGLKYGDERKILLRLRAIITDLNSLVRSASFSMTEFERSVRNEAKLFWKLRR